MCTWRLHPTAELTPRPIQLCRGPPSHPDQARGRRILAPPSREALLAPSGFDWAAAAATAAEVPAELELEHVHGYESVRNAAPNVHLACGGRRLVHYAAALGISTSLPDLPSALGTAAGAPTAAADLDLCVRA